MVAKSVRLLVACLAGFASIAFGRMQSLVIRDRKPEPVVQTEGPVLFLLHGLANSPVSMKMLEKEGRKRGYTVVNWGYRTRNHAIDDIADKLVESVRAYENGSGPIHFVGHSLGGIVIRRMLDKHTPKNLGRVVMIGTPNQGADFAETVGEWKLFHKLYGKTGQDLRKTTESMALIAGIPKCEFGVIAGGTGTRYGMNPVVPGDDDGLVTVASTRLPGMKDWIRLPHAHGLIQIMPRSVDNTFLFLETGRFEEDAPRDFVEKDPAGRGIVRVPGIMESQESPGGS